MSGSFVKNAACLFLVVLAAALVGCTPASNQWIDGAGEFDHNISLSTNRINVGSLVVAELDIVHPSDTQPVFTDPGDDEQVIVRDRAWDSRPLADGRQLSSVRYKITSFALGEHRIFDGDLKFMRGDELVETREFGDILISVESLLSGTDPEMRDIAGWEKFPARFPRWLPILLLIALLAATVGALFARYFRHREKAALTPPRPAADELALHDLRALRAQGWIEAAQVEPFYVELSRIVRSYIENRFSLRAPEQTTEEFIRAAAESEQLSVEHRQLTSEFLIQSDMVKFARYQPKPEMMEDAFSSAERLVIETAPAGASAEEGAE